MTNVNILFFSEDEIPLLNEQWISISSFEAIRDTICEIYPDNSDNFKQLNHLYQIKKDCKSLEQLSEIHLELKPYFGKNVLGVNQTSGGLMDFRQLVDELAPFDFFLNSLLAWHLENGSVQTAGAALIGLPDIQFKEGALEPTGPWIADLFEWLQTQPDIENRPYIEWDKLGKYRISKVEGWESDDPYFNPAGMLKLIRSL